jgi:hypothetical protein
MLIEEATNKHYKNPAQRVDLEQSGPHQHLIENSNHPLTKLANNPMPSQTRLTTRVLWAQTI